jgi:nicotinamide riboside kinase
VTAGLAPGTGRVIALLGAESTGKTTLAAALAAALRDRGHVVQMVPEVLRDFCERRGRTPRIDEQQGIAEVQTARIEEACGMADRVVADTTALMVAVYSEIVFGDRSLLDPALESQRRFGLTLVTANDLPWVADGLQREGDHVRGPVSERLLAALERGCIAWRAVAGSGPARLAAALAAVDAAGLG